DVTDRKSIDFFRDELADAIGIPDILVNNAGLARGTERVADAEGIAWREMIETNLLGSLWMTRSFLPAMLERGSGHVIYVGSVAGHKGYAGGSVYCATKAGILRICEALRLETLGRGIRVTTVDPGAAETEFSIVRFSGDEAAAEKVYDGYEPLHAQDVADCVYFAATRPPHVNIDEIQVMPTAQADPWHVARATDPS
ncbi:MAG: SDR family NAD(P)-dependent oxidoreductase, partial [Planctomycetes bacterium]|nr:SDR family NAD(P)-dependent oxidoreductase [Planctomycetota bacterium]